MSSEEKLDHILRILNAQKLPTHLEYKVFAKELEDVGITFEMGDLVEKLNKNGHINNSGFMYGITEDGRIFWDNGNGGYVNEKRKKLESEKNNLSLLNQSEERNKKEPDNYENNIIKLKDDGPHTEMEKPKFKTEAIPDIFEILKNYFPKQQAELKNTLESGNDAINPLVFHGNGNRIAHAFKELHDGQFLFYAENKYLENWIIKNFRYLYRRMTKEFTPSYINKIISGRIKPPKGKRILKVENGKIITLTLTNRQQNEK